jgi:helicase
VTRRSSRELEFAWVKVADSEAEVPVVQPGAEMRVLLPEDDLFTVMAEKLSGSGAQVRRVRYLLEDETIALERGRLTALSRVTRLGRPYRGTHTELTGTAAAAARDAFDVLWETHSPAAGPGSPGVPTEAVVPAELLPFLPFSSLNPAQAQALPQILEHDENLLVVAPTGAGKTVIGMTAALRAVVQQRRKAAWLVPQRSLTDELDRELAGWRRAGLRVERLSGEHAVDIERIHEADLWVATTEKFEAICRASAFRESLAGVGALVVDEIHMLGDTERGAVLEALLARIRDGGADTRIVGLSATVSNAEEIAEWLRAKLLRCAWRPSRLTWQLPSVPASSDFAVTEAARTRLATAITGLVTGDGGSVLVFCGSKRNVRRTALVIAASRGVDVSGVRPDDLERLQRVCDEGRIGLHYQGWEHRRAAEQAFRQRELDVLVATTTVAAGVNLPARAVVVQDTQVGLNALDVATVQQMFGRAGRVGTGEDEGWAFLIVDERERAEWQSKLVAGHTVRSRIQAGLPEHVLSEAVQRRIGTLQDAENWWVQTLAYFQGQRSLRPLRKSVQFLRAAQMLSLSKAEDSQPVPTQPGPAQPVPTQLVPTELGRLTARLMVSPEVCDRLRGALSEVSVPSHPDQAEAVLIELLAALVPKLAQARVGEDGKAALAYTLATFGAVHPVVSPSGLDGVAGESGPQRGDLARAALLTVARAPSLFHPGVRQVNGIPYAAMYQILEEAPRYLHWIACQGLFGTIHPWCAIVAADLELRTAWRVLQPPRGAGRLLWACEQMATAAHAAQAVPELWAAARARGYASPDWPAAGRPAQCRLDADGYHSFLRDRATGVVIEADNGKIRGSGPAGSVLTTWRGSAFAVTPVKRGYAVAEVPSASTRKPGPGKSGPGRTRLGESAPESGAAVFTWRGDYRASGWLSAYSQTALSPALLALVYQCP